MTKPRLRRRDPRAGIVLLLFVLMMAWSGASLDAGAEPRDEAPRPQAEDQFQALVEELSRVLGMTPAEVEALGLSPAEMRSLIAGFTEETVVVGSRAEPRSATESAVPVDVLTASDLVSQGTGDLKDQLRTIIPSFSTNTQPISGVSTVVRPAMLRNLAPDHTLVLINGKRRHRSSIVDYHGGNGVAFGSQGPHISATPALPRRAGGGGARRGAAPAPRSARRAPTPPPSPRSRCGRSRCCATAPRRSTGPTRLPAC